GRTIYGATLWSRCTQRYCFVAQLPLTPLDDRSPVSANPPAPGVDSPAWALDGRAQRNILIAMITALVAVIAAMSGLNVAQQDMAMELGASQSAVLWIINAYTVTLAALLLPVGAIGDRWGRKPVLLVGLAVFGLATLGS